MKKTLGTVLLLFLFTSVAVYYYKKQEVIKVVEQTELVEQNVDASKEKITVVTAYRLLAPIKNDARQGKLAQLNGYREKAGLSSPNLKIHGILSEINFYEGGCILELSRAVEYVPRTQRERIFFVRVQVSLPWDGKWENDKGMQLEKYLTERIEKPITVYGLLSGVGTTGAEEISTDYWVLVSDVIVIDDIVIL